jgi:hypothetical protein
MDVRVRELLKKQDSVVSTWQLRANRITTKQILRLARGWQQLHDGVHLASFSKPTPLQRWRAATLTTPTTVLSHVSAAACLGLRRERGRRYRGFETVTRPGSKGPQWSRGLLVHYSRSLAGNVVQREGFLVTTPERTIVDLAPQLVDWDQRKMLREAIVNRIVTIASMRAALRRHRGRRGTVRLNALVLRYERLRLERCDSDAEAYGMEILDDNERPLPDVNEEINGHRADFSWPEHMLIIEIDGPQFHRDKLLDAHKTALWVAAGWTVRRISSDDVFADPQTLLALAPVA